MDIEQLKLILATLHDAGTGAFVFGICYLAKDVVLAAVFLIGLGIIATKIARLVADAHSKYEKERNDYSQSLQSEGAVLDRVAYLSGTSRPLWLSDRAKVDAWLSRAESAMKATK